MRTCHTNYLNSPIMQISKAIFAIILLCPVLNVFSQSVSDFIVIDEIADNMTQLEAEFKEQPNVYWTDGNSVNALSQIAFACEGKQIENLHIYVPTKPGAIVFSSIAITSNDVGEVAEELKVLSNFVSKTVVIHSNHVFMGEKGQLLKQQLEEITGLLFTTQN
jgi:hypothetical protein